MRFPACVLLLFAVAATVAWARLGDSPEQTDRRYGQPVAASGQPGQLTSTRTYSVSGLEITCGYLDGKVAMETYARDDRSFNCSEVEALLRTNGGKKGGWKTPPDGFVPGHYTRADGATGTWSENQVTVQMPTWAAAVAHDEAAAKAGHDQPSAASSDTNAPAATNEESAGTNTAPATSATNAP